MNDHVHVFAGQFADRAAACQYTERQWEPEPDESVPDEEYKAWESRNPQWALRADLGAYLDSDFIETIDGGNRYDYLQSLLTEPGAVRSIREQAGPESNILVLIFDKALGGFEATVKSTPRLTYCGKYPCRL